jgi:mono/diheme cytochrome c family protein
MIRHLLIVVAMVIANISWLIWLCRTVDPSTKYGSEVEYNYARYCAGCHGAWGEGDGRIGRFKRLNPADFTRPEFWERRNDEGMMHSIASGKEDMPSFSVYLTSEEQKNLLAFIKGNFQPRTSQSTATK